MEKYHRDPWGNESNQPPDLDKILSNFFRKLQGIFGSRQNNNGGGDGASGVKTSTVVIFAAIILFIIWLALGIFIVSPAEEAVVLRFGKYQTTMGPGPHWVPRLIDSYYKVNVQRVNSFSFDVDLLTRSSGEADKPKPIVKVKAASDDKDDDTDKNVVRLELSIQYRIVDPKLYLFNIANGEQTLKEVAQSQLSSVIGNMGLDEVLTRGRDQVAMDVSKNVQQLMEQYQTGISIVAVNVRKAQAPEEVADAFLDVVQAGQDEQRYIQQAQAYASKVVPIAEGARSRILADANAYQEKVVLSAQANVASYLAVLNVYKSSPAVTRQRLYLETMQNVLMASNKVLVDAKNNNSLMYLPLDQLQKNHSKLSESSMANAKSTSAASQVVQDNTKPSAADIYSQWYQSNN